MVQGQGTGIVETLDGILPAQREQPQTGAIGLFGMCLAGQFGRDPALDVRAQLCSPLPQPCRRPLLVFLVCDRHVGRHRGEARRVLAHMGGHRFLVQI